MYDPLINWRLLNAANAASDSGTPLPPDGRRFSSSEIVTDEQQSFRTYSTSRRVPMNVIVMDSIGDSDDTGAESLEGKPDVLNSKAVAVIQRVSNKLSGM